MGRERKRIISGLVSSNDGSVGTGLLLSDVTHIIDLAWVRLCGDNGALLNPTGVATPINRSVKSALRFDDNGYNKYLSTLCIIVIKQCWYPNILYISILIFHNDYVEFPRWRLESYASRIKCWCGSIVSANDTDGLHRTGERI